MARTMVYTYILNFLAPHPPKQYRGQTKIVSKMKKSKLF